MALNREKIEEYYNHAPFMTNCRGVVDIEELERWMNANKALVLDMISGGALYVTLPDEHDAYHEWCPVRWYLTLEAAKRGGLAWQDGCKRCDQCGGKGTFHVEEATRG